GLAGRAASVSPQTKKLRQDHHRKQRAEEFDQALLRLGPAMGGRGATMGADGRVPGCVTTTMQTGRHTYPSFEKSVASVMESLSTQYHSIHDVHGRRILLRQCSDAEVGCTPCRCPEVRGRSHGIVNLLKIVTRSLSLRQFEGVLSQISTFHRITWWSV